MGSLNVNVKGVNLLYTQVEDRCFLSSLTLHAIPGVTLPFSIDFQPGIEIIEVTGDTTGITIRTPQPGSAIPLFFQHCEAINQALADERDDPHPEPEEDEVDYCLVCGDVIPPGPDFCSQACADYYDWIQHQDA